MKRFFQYLFLPIVLISFIPFIIILQIWVGWELASRATDRLWEP